MKMIDIQIDNIDRQIDMLTDRQYQIDGWYMARLVILETLIIIHVISLSN